MSERLDGIWHPRVRATRRASCSLIFEQLVGRQVIHDASKSNRQLFCELTRLAWPILWLTSCSELFHAMTSLLEAVDLTKSYRFNTTPGDLMQPLTAR